jgi:hypothetical protein
MMYTCWCETTDEEADARQTEALNPTDAAEKFAAAWLERNPARLNFFPLPVNVRADGGAVRRASVDVHLRPVFLAGPRL